MITNDMIKDLVNENFEELIMDISEFKACIATSGLKEKEVRTVLMFNEQILRWINKVVNAPEKAINLETKVNFVKEIFNTIDTNFQQVGE